MNKDFTIAIVDPNVLTGIGLQNILEDIIPIADIRIFTSFDTLQQAEHENFVHFFVSSRIYFEHTQFFRDRHQRSIVLVSGDMQISGVLTLNVCQSEHQLIKALIGLHSMGHTAAHGNTPEGHPGKMPAGMGENGMSEGMPQSMAGMAHKHPHPIMGSQHQINQSLLSAREVEVARLLSKGLINKEVADALSISLTTVITHRKNIMEKLHARSLADIIIYSVMNGLVDVGEL